MGPAPPLPDVANGLLADAVPGGHVRGCDWLGAARFCDLHLEDLDRLISGQLSAGGLVLMFFHDHKPENFGSSPSFSFFSDRSEN
jgi:hypothetical protein